MYTRQTASIPESNTTFRPSLTRSRGPLPSTLAAQGRLYVHVSHSSRCSKPTTPRLATGQWIRHSSEKCTNYVASVRNAPPRPQNGIQTRTDRCPSADRPEQRPWPLPARLVRPHRPLEVGENEQSGSKHTNMTSNRYMKSQHRRSFAGELWVDVPSRFLRRGSGQNMFRVG